MPTPYHVRIAPAAERQIKAFPAKQHKLVLTLLEALAVNPRPPGVQKIEGMTGLYSETIMPFRIVYKVEDLEILILLVKPGSI